MSQTCRHHDFSLIFFIIDFCATANCSDLCVNEDSKAICLCKEGFKLKDDGLTCEGNHISKEEGKYQELI